MNDKPDSIKDAEALLESIEAGLKNSDLVDPIVAQLEKQIDLLEVQVDAAWNRYKPVADEADRLRAEHDALYKQQTKLIRRSNALYRIGQRESGTA